MVKDMCDILGLLCISYSGACDMFVTCCDTFKENRISKTKNTVHEHVTLVTNMSRLHLKHFHLIMIMSHMSENFL